jgi:hypothetical protein
MKTGILSFKQKNYQAIIVYRWVFRQEVATKLVNYDFKVLAGRKFEEVVILPETSKKDNPALDILREKYGAKRKMVCINLINIKWRITRKSNLI